MPPDDGDDAPPPDAVELPIEEVLDLHSFPPAQTADLVREWLREVEARGWRDVRVVHGRGIGAQRRIVRSLLEREPAVEAFGDAPPETGGWGATWVRLRPSRSETALPENCSRLLPMAAMLESAASLSTEIEVKNPATGERVGSVRSATPAEVAAAVERARVAQARWAARPVRQRAGLLWRYHDLVLDRSDEILDVIQKESGKARRDALLDVLTVAGTARYYAARGKRFLRDQRGEGAVFGFTSARVVFKPYGVVGIISPWNFPFLLAIGDALPALLAGNAVVLKPSELTPFSAEIGRTLLLEAGCDPDLFQIVHGRGEVGAELLRHVDYIGFTGGTATGRKVAVAASERLLPYSLELGGKNPMVVLDGAPVEEAVTGLIAGAFNNSGQTCISIERIYVQDGIYDAFVKAAVDRVSKLKLGYSAAWDVDMGSLISAAHAAKVTGHVTDAVAQGAEILTGGHPRRDLGPAFVEPTLLAGVKPGMKVFREETFGPVVAIYRVPDAAEAVRLANDSDYGLNASVWGGDARLVREVSRRLETGSTGINSTLLIYHSFDVPMGGIKTSGIGRRHGRYGIVRYTQAQSIVRSSTIAGGYEALLVRTTSRAWAQGLIRLFRLRRWIPGLR